jgi:Response regulator receiver domain
MGDIPASTTSDPPTSQANVLLVDDHPANLLALEAVLDDPDRTIVRAASGEEALRLLLDRDFAVVLLDVRMPAGRRAALAAWGQGRLVAADRRVAGPVDDAELRGGSAPMLPGTCSGFCGRGRNGFSGRNQPTRRSVTSGCP